MPNSSHLAHHPQFTCPHCQSPLIPHAKTWQCDGSLNPKNTQHPFDVARQGYVNLLPVQSKKTKDPGDSQDSIDARHRFLNQGFYQPLQQLITTLINKVDNNDKGDNKPKNWLDIGCGEGYYTQAIAQALKTPSVLHINHLIALDISKPAITQLSKTAKQQQSLWHQIGTSQQNIKSMQEQGAMISLTPLLSAIYPLVASAANLPLADNNVDGISTIFSPILPKEFARVLQTEGRLLIAKPDIGHLQTLREALFDEVRPHDSDKFLEELAPFFTLKDTHHVQADLSLDLPALTDLLTMTPYSYRAKLENKDALLASAKTETFKTKAKFVVYELVKV